MPESSDMHELHPGTDYEVETIHRFRGRFVGVEKNGNSEVAVFEAGGRDRKGKPYLRKVPAYNFRRAAS